ncbi:hypothetical protein CERSUDRAFT_114481 [Gelatoporia subvermispora B]|uniref:Uncharacterized protein n=1 Tax=Ceriporiopsis subvermispora (strain B) TaxID=914234 RepID=M2PN27_CERS8|nr:hypothetical protein CERSUDRAFT_114481 [Gelatoporia subvermispora B]
MRSFYAATSSLASQATRLWLTGVTALSIEETLRPIRIHELSEIGIPLLSHLPGEDRTAWYSTFILTRMIISSLKLSVRKYMSPRTPW